MSNFSKEKDRYVSDLRYSVEVLDKENKALKAQISEAQREIEARNSVIALMTKDRDGLQDELIKADERSSAAESLLEDAQGMIRQIDNWDMGQPLATERWLKRFAAYKASNKEKK